MFTTTFHGTSNPTSQPYFYFGDGKRLNISDGKLTLRHERLSEQDWMDIALALPTYAIAKLEIDSIWCTSKNIAPIIQELQRSQTLREFTLNDEHVSQNLAACLADALAVNTSLHIFRLNGGDVRRHAILHFSNALNRNTTLQELDLRLNGINRYCAEPLVQGLENNRTLRKLVLRSNDLSDDGALQFANLLRENTSLQVLDLYYNGITTYGTIHLADALIVNTSLLELNLQFNLIDGKDKHCTRGTEALANALKRNNSLRVLRIDSHRHYFRAHPLKMEQIVLEAIRVNFTIEMVDEVNLSKDVEEHLAANKARNALKDKLQKPSLRDLFHPVVLRYDSSESEKTFYKQRLSRARAAAYHLSIKSLLEKALAKEFYPNKERREIASELEKALEKEKPSKGSSSEYKRAFCRYKLDIRQICEGEHTPLLDMVQIVLDVASHYPKYRENLNQNPIALYLALKFNPPSEKSILHEFSSGYDLRKLICEQFIVALEHLYSGDEKLYTKLSESTIINKDDTYNEESLIRFYEKHILRLNPVVLEPSLDECDDERRDYTEAHSSDERGLDDDNEDIAASTIWNLIQSVEFNRLNLSIKAADIVLEDAVRGRAETLGVRQNIRETTCNFIPCYHTLASNTERSGALFWQSNNKAIHQLFRWALTSLPGEMLTHFTHKFGGYFWMQVLRRMPDSEESPIRRWTDTFREHLGIAGQLQAPEIANLEILHESVAQILIGGVVNCDRKAAGATFWQSFDTDIHHVFKWTLVNLDGEEGKESVKQLASSLGIDFWREVFKSYDISNDNSWLLSFSWHLGIETESKTPSKVDAKTLARIKANLKVLYNVAMQATGSFESIFEIFYKDRRGILGGEFGWRANLFGTWKLNEERIRRHASNSSNQKPNASRRTLRVMGP